MLETSLKHRASKSQNTFLIISTLSLPDWISRWVFFRLLYSLAIQVIKEYSSLWKRSFQCLITALLLQKAASFSNVAENRYGDNSRLLDKVLEIEFLIILLSLWLKFYTFLYSSPFLCDCSLLGDYFCIGIEKEFLLNSIDFSNHSLYFFMAWLTC